MKFPDRKLVEKVRKEYPVGCRVELISMDDIQAPPPGTKGTVTHVDDAGDICIRWDSGCGLKAIYGVDMLRVLTEVAKNT